MPHTRRDLLEGIGLATTTVAAYVATPSFIGWDPTLYRFGSSDTLTRAALSGDVDVDTFGTDGHPSFAVRYEDGDDGHDALLKWVDSHDAVDIRRDLDTTNTVILTAPWEDIGVSNRFGVFEQIDGGLQGLDYVSLVDADARVDIPEPIDADDLESTGAVSHDLSVGERLRLAASSSRETTSGLAFDGDAPEATLQEARRLVGAGSDVTDSVDTSETTVCVIDTGLSDLDIFLDAEEEDFRVHPQSTNFTESGDPTVGEDGMSEIDDDNGHGDWVAACIAARNDDTRFQGPAPDSELLIAKALDGDGGGSVGDIVAGVELAIDQGADVICMSLGAQPWNQTLADVVTEAVDEDIFVAAASGNDRFATVWTANPANAEDAMAINATNVPESGDPDDTRIAYFGNVGPAPGTVDLSEGESTGATPKLAAPGMNVRIDPVGTLTGTSMAAPMVVAGATLLSAAGHDADEIWDRLTRCAHPLPKAGVTETEYGLLDVEAALADREPDESQDDVRDDDALSRDELNETLSDATGRRLAGLF